MHYCRGKATCYNMIVSRRECGLPIILCLVGKRENRVYNGFEE